jgi:hypothetical protein|tara:strand:- start:286 stop:402 length:117 start_codon:yes stop_codon:yes gene_type:complete
MPEKAAAPLARLIEACWVQDARRRPHIAEVSAADRSHL